MRMFHTVEKKIGAAEHRSDSKEHPESKHERGAQFEANPKVELLDSTPNVPNISASKAVMPPKTTIKDRRRLAQNEAMQLRLPLDLPELPARNRTPISEISSIVPSRPRSPKTPWIQERPPEWHISGLKTAPPTINEDEEPTLLAGNDPIILSQTPRSEATQKPFTPAASARQFQEKSEDKRESSLIRRTQKVERRLSQSTDFWSKEANATRAESSRRTFSLSPLPLEHLVGIVQGPKLNSTFRTT
ncbi:hypothetical protein N0V90_009740 [Kalmusia sp. IMI 367209]|nr:hypothetical protein N0V90_009740 [Kalmusia sp. IMI 367209]